MTKQYGINMASIDETIRVLKELQVSRCCYKSAKFCDCKYLNEENTLEQEQKNGSEKTGCCEVRSAIEYLQELKDIKEVLRPMA